MQKSEGSALQVKLFKIMFQQIDLPKNGIQGGKGVTKGTMVGEKFPERVAERSKITWGFVSNDDLSGVYSKCDGSHQRFLSKE